MKKSINAHHIKEFSDFVSTLDESTWHSINLRAKDLLIKQQKDLNDPIEYNKYMTLELLRRYHEWNKN